MSRLTHLFTKSRISPSTHTICHTRYADTFTHAFACIYYPCHNDSCPSQINRYNWEEVIPILKVVECLD
ncbi:hypothetical protein [Vibrio phage vB_VhaP_PG11]|nr:hypothetical protein [Vibrio phage vB_VhaP_PG11]